VVVWGLVDACAERQGMSRSEVVWHLVVYAGLCGGDFPLTKRIASLPGVDMDRVVAEVRERAEANDPPKPQGFRQWVKEAAGRIDDETMDAAAKGLLDELLG